MRSRRGSPDSGLSAKLLSWVGWVCSDFMPSASRNPFFLSLKGRWRSRPHPPTTKDTAFGKAVLEELSKVG